MIRILAVDNDPYTLKLFEKLLRDKNIELDIASNGREALKLFAEKTFNLVLMDQRLQAEKGMDLLREMWKHHPRQLAILMTGLVEDSEAFRKAQTGLFACLSKPFKNLEELERMIEKALELDLAYREIKDLRHALEAQKKGRVG